MRPEADWVAPVAVRVEPAPVKLAGGGKRRRPGPTKVRPKPREPLLERKLEPVPPLLGLLVERDSAPPQLAAWDWPLVEVRLRRPPL